MGQIGGILLWFAALAAALWLLGSQRWLLDAVIEAIDNFRAVPRPQCTLPHRLTALCFAGGARARVSPPDRAGQSIFGIERRGITESLTVSLCFPDDASRNLEIDRRSGVKPTVLFSVVLFACPSLMISQDAPAPIGQSDSRPTGIRVQGPGVAGSGAGAVLPRHRDDLSGDGYAIGVRLGLGARSETSISESCGK